MSERETTPATSVAPPKLAARAVEPPVTYYTAKGEVVPDAPADHASYTMEMSLEEIQRLEREKAAMLREHVRAPKVEAPVIESTEGRYVSPVAPTLESLKDAVAVESAPVDNRMNVPTVTQAVQRAVVIQSREPLHQECPNRCDVRNGGGYYHCHACTRTWREGQVVAVGGLKRMVSV